MTPAGRRVRRAAQAATAAKSKRDDLICEMRAEGASLRDIAEAAQMTHPSVLRILRARGLEVPPAECRPPPRPRVAEVRTFVAHLRRLESGGARPPDAGPYALAMAEKGFAVWEAWLADPDHPRVDDLVWLREWQVRTAQIHIEQKGYDPLAAERATAFELIARMLAAARPWDDGSPAQ
jgi:hypothetical protein